MPDPMKPMRKEPISPRPTRRVSSMSHALAKADARSLQQHLAGAGQLHRTGGALQKRMTDDLFQFANLLGEWWLREIQPFRGAAKMQFFGDRDEIAQVAQFHVRNPYTKHLNRNKQAIGHIRSGLVWRQEKQRCPSETDETVAGRSDASRKTCKSDSAFRPGDEEDFGRLNEEWIVRYFALEAKDQQVLDDPVTHILNPGGQIIMAASYGRNIGCCALVRLEEGVYELAKMAVTEALRGRGIGRQILDFAPERRKPSLYTRADVFMEMWLNQKQS